MKNSILTIALFVFFLPVEIIAKDIKLPKDVGFGNSYNKSLTGDYYKDYGMQIVSKNNNHPVRFGKESIRFEVQPGDCGADKNGDWNDCENDRERHELSGERMEKGSTWWYAWSLYIPKNHINVYPTRLCLGQFHQTGGHPVFMFEEEDGGYWLDRSIYGPLDERVKILKKENMKGKWNDILVSMKWAEDEKGYFKLWTNGNLLYDYRGQTKTKGTKTYFKFGIYRTGMTRWLQSKNNINNEKVVPGQIVYYDEVRIAKKCEKLNLSDLDYSCDDIKSQKKMSKKEKLIITFKKKVIQKILAKVGKDKQIKVKKWTEQQVTKWSKESNFGNEITSMKSRKDKRNQLIKKGIKKFQ